MTQFTFTSPEGKTYKVTGPEGATQEQAFQMLQTQLGGGASPAKPAQPSAAQIPGADPKPAPPVGGYKPTEEPGFLDKAAGLGEAALSVGTGATSGLLGMINGGVAGGIGNLTGGKYGTKGGVEKGLAQGLESSTYAPRTEKGKEYLGAFADFAKSAGLDALPGMANELAVMGKLGAAAKPGIANEVSKTAQAAQAAGALKDDIKATIPPKPSMAGVGAAKTGDALLRSQRAEDLPVPIKLTKGQQDRTFEQQKFERETAKMKEGEPLRERYADQNEKILQNFDAFIDQSGAQQPSLRQVGAVVDKALVDKVKKAKTEIDSAYDAARAAGEMEQKIKLSPLAEYIDKNKSAMKNSPILKVIEAEIKAKSKPIESRQSSVMGEPAIKPSPFERDITLNDLQEIRKTINKNATEGPNAMYGGEMKKIIDGLVEGKGGEKYKQAQRLYENYSKEFKDKAAISKLLRNKPGTTDRAVAMEDVFDHSIMKGSLDDVRAVRRTLQTAGEDGQQAWKELQGQTLKNIKDTITSGSQRDIRGNQIVSPDKLNRLVNELDKDGKLDFVFGKKGAAKLRDINDIAKDIYTAPPGSVNPSNTATILLGLLDTTASMMTGLPLPIASAAGYGVKKLKSRNLSKQVQSALDDDRPSLIPPVQP